MAEPASIKERMEALGWSFQVDYDCDGEAMVASALKLSPIAGRTGHFDVIAYDHETAYHEDHAACRAAWKAEWDADGKPKEPTR